MDPYADVSAEGHEIYYAMTLLPTVTRVVCSCGWRWPVVFSRAQNVGFAEILDWVAYKHTGRSRRWR
jgi:hypothetical protein